MFSAALVLSRRCASAGSRTRRSCSYSSSASSSSHIDEWFESIRKPQEFYDLAANSTKSRSYFYNVDLHGRLFLECTRPKNVASSIKDPKFLDFFFARIRRLNEREQKHLLDLGGALADYPFISPCGTELNFIRPAATPIVFHTFDETALRIQFGGSMCQKFDPSWLAVSPSTGRLYHKLREGSKEGGPRAGGVSRSSMKYGLVQSSVAVQLSGSMHLNENGALIFDCQKSGPYEIDWLKAEDEPGCWSFQM